MNMAPPFTEDAETHWKYLRETITQHWILTRKTIIDVTWEEFMNIIGYHYTTAMVHGFGHGYEQGFVAGAFESDLNPNQLEREAARRGGESHES